MWILDGSSDFPFCSFASALAIIGKLTSTKLIVDMTAARNRGLRYRAATIAAGSAIMAAGSADGKGSP